jgi:Zn-dependent protease with chaperone function
MPRALLVAVLVLATGCAGLDERAYYPPGGPATRALAEALYRAAQAAGDDPARYSFALLASRDVSAFSADDATFYFSEGLLRQPESVIDAIVAQQVAHEVLGHAGQRRALSWSLTAGFTVLGIIVPGAGLLDFALNPLIVRAFTRDQVIAADLRAVEILRSMGYAAPLATLAAALHAAHAINGARGGGLLASEPPIEDRLAALGPLEPGGPRPARAGR